MIGSRLLNELADVVHRDADAACERDDIEQANHLDRVAAQVRRRAVAAEKKELKEASKQGDLVNRKTWDAPKDLTR